MIELIFHFEYPTNPKCNCTYKMIQFEKGVWTLFSLKGVQFATLQKIDGVWEQIGGRQTLDEVVSDTGKLIDSMNYGH